MVHEGYDGEALRLSEERLKDAQTRLEAALSAGDIATWTWDVVNNKVVADANLARLFSVDPEAASGGKIESYLTNIHPEDRQKIAATIAEAIDNEDAYEAEYRVALPDGSYRWLLARGKVERGESGQAISLPGVVVDITARKEIADALARSEARFRVQADAMPQLVWATDPKGNHLYYNRRWYEYTGQSIEESMGFGFALALHPDDTERTLERWQRAWENGADYEIEYRFRRHDGVYRWFVGRAEPVRDPETDEITMWAGTCTDIDELKRAQEELRRVLESSPDCIKTLDLDGNLLSMTMGGQKIMEVDHFPSICNIDWLTFWDGEHRDLTRQAIQQAKAGETGRFVGFCPTRKGTPRWWDVVVAPIMGTDGKPEQLLGISRDVTFQHQAQERQRFLSELTERARRSVDIEAVIEETTRSVGQFIGLSRFLYADLEGPEGTITVHRDWCDPSSGIESAEGVWSLAEWGRTIAPWGTTREYLRNGQTVVLNDFATDARTRVDFESNGDKAEHTVIRAAVRLPLLRDGRWVAMLSAQSVEPRDWSPEDVALLETIAERTWLTLENTRLLHLARAQAEAERARAERETLLNQIGTAVRTSLDSEAILQATVNALGQGLRADRCYFVRYNQTRDTAQVVPEWYRAEDGLEPLVGRTFQMSTYSVDRDPAYKAGRTHVVDDVVAFEPEDAAPILALNIRSLLRVPIESGDQMTALSIAMASEPRHWMEDEIRLVENVATLVRSTLESAFAQQRERNIAQQLQGVLMPQSPPRIPGFDLASFYRPALSEAGVGGDFFDVFRVEKGCTALVVADLSGKGLAAASQVATLKNMLRYSLYTGASVADAVTGLHRVLVEHDLLAGFATLFVGMYDQTLRTITYVNCGQEPGLVWRAATGEVEHLEPTGSVLGGFAAANGFTQRTVNLLPEDVIALFTDGVTEVGPSRRNQLGVKGVCDILRSSCEAVPRTKDSQFVVDQLMARVESFAGDGARDDIALLVGIVQADSLITRIPGALRVEASETGASFA